MDSIIYDGVTYEGRSLKSVSYNKVESLPAAALHVNTLTAIVVSKDPTIVSFAQNAPLRYLRGGSQVALAYVKEIRTVGEQLYQITAISTVGLLTQMEHRGGVYAGETVSAVVADICGGLPVYIQSNFASIPLYGWLPYVAPNGEAGAKNGSARDNLMRVLFDIGANLRTDAQGVLRIENLPTSPQSVIGANRVYLRNASVLNEAPVTAVTILEHQYITGGDTATLFDGTATGNQTIVFAEPMSNLAATGLTIVESGANYAVVSGTGTLTGSKYIHTTREVTGSITIHDDAYKPHYKGLGPILGAIITLEAGVSYSVASQDFGTLNFTADQDYRADLVNTKITLRIANGSVVSAYIVLPPAPGPGHVSRVSYSLSAGQGDEPLLSNAYEWQLVSSGAVSTPNVVRLEDTTLVGVTSSAAVLNRLIEYYKHRRTLSLAVGFEFEEPGDVLTLYDPFLGQNVDACLASCTVTPSEEVEAKITALVGYTPWQTEAFEDVRELLTGSGAWTPTGLPVGTEVTGIAIGRGSSGAQGENGQTAADNEVIHTGSGTWSSGAKNGGSGGAGGAGGDGGRIYRFSFVVSNSSSITYDATGTDSEFGSFSSATGASLDEGYYDPVVQITYAAKGANGIDGADGGAGGSVSNYGYGGKSIPDGEGGYYYGGSGSAAYSGSGGTSGSTADYGGNGGGGAAFGNAGTSATRYGGGAGANAVSPLAPTIYGTGGTGGNGGGGGGGAGGITATGTGDGVWEVNEGGAGGAGSAGSDGAPGCIVLYYRRPVS